MDPSRLSSSLLWEILTPLTHTRDTIIAAFALCCHRTLYLLDPELRDRHRDWRFSQEARKLWEYHFGSTHWPPAPGWGSYRLVCCAARTGNLQLVQWMVEKWLPIDAEIYAYCYQVLRSAALYGNLQLVQWLVEKWPPRLSDFTGPWYYVPLTMIGPNPEIHRYLKQVQQELELQQQAATAQPAQPPPPETASVTQ